MSEDPKLTIDEAATLLGVSRRTIYNHDKAGKLRIEHEKGKPFVRRSQIDMYLEKKKMKVQKTKFIPEGSILVEAERYEAMLQRNQYLEGQNRLLLTYEEQIEEDKRVVLGLEEELAEAKAEADRLKKRGLWARIFNKGAE